MLKAKTIYPVKQGKAYHQLLVRLVYSTLTFSPPSLDQPGLFETYYMVVQCQLHHNWSFKGFEIKNDVASLQAGLEL